MSGWWHPVEVIRHARLRVPARIFCAPVAIPLAIIALAFFARFHALDAQSLWNDEGNSLRLAQRDVSDLINAAGRDIHPPGYYLALKGWIALAGESEFSLRALSALAGVVAVAITLTLGKTLFFERGAARIAALLVAISPFAVYYSQEARMYAPLALLSAASMWAFAVWARSGQWRHAVLLGAINAAGLYTQYSFPFTMIAQGAWFGWATVRHPSYRRALPQFLALNILTLALFAPWLPTAWDQVTAWPRAGVELRLDAQLRVVMAWLVYGNTAGDTLWIAFLWPGALILAALWQRRSVGILLLWAGVAVGALIVSGAFREANLKFLLPAQIAVALLIGRGVAALWDSAAATAAEDPHPSAGVVKNITRRISAADKRQIRRMVALVCLFLVVRGQLDALNALYNDSDYARDDYRAMAARITNDLRPGDAIILDAPNQAEVFTYYYDGAAPIYGLPRGLGGDDAQTRAATLDVIATHDRVWAVFWGEAERDPNRVVQATLDENAYPVASDWYGDARLAQYAVLDAAPTEPDARANAQFGDHITLIGYALSADRLRPGDALGVTLFWTADAPLEARYKVTVQMLAPDGSLVTQHDAEPGGNRALTTTWEPGAAVMDTHGMVAPLDLAPGDYTIMVGLYEINPPYERLPVMVDGTAVGDALALAALGVASP